MRDKQSVLPAAPRHLRETPCKRDWASRSTIEEEKRGLALRDQSYCEIVNPLILAQFRRCEDVSIAERCQGPVRIDG
jgi:hypothetical protein